MKHVTKTALVRSLPFDMPAKDVVARAKALGLTMSEPVVHALRSTARKRDGATPRKAPGAAVPSSGRRTAHREGAETLLRACAAELGFPRAIALLCEERAKVERLLPR